MARGLYVASSVGAVAGGIAIYAEYSGKLRELLPPDYAGIAGFAATLGGAALVILGVSNLLPPTLFERSPRI